MKVATWELYLLPLFLNAENREEGAEKRRVFRMYVDNHDNHDNHNNHDNNDNHDNHDNSDNNDNSDNPTTFKTIIMPHLIRPVCASDAAAILEIYAPYVLETPVTFEEVVPDETEIVARIDHIASKLPYLVCEIDGKVAGYAYATDFRTRAAYRWIKELSVYIHPDFRRKNIASALYFCVVNLLKYQGVTSALACITVPNPVSVNFHENFGFRKVGEFEANGYKLGKWHNVGWWEMHLDPEHKAPVDQVIPINNLPESVRDDIFRKGSGMILL